jgi:hypothetical protein
VIDPVTGRPTRYWHAGDVLSGDGWVDWWVQDKRNLLSLGPISFSPGQVESVRVAFVVGDKENRRASTADMLDVSRCVKRLNAKGAFLEPSAWAIVGFYPQPFDPSDGVAGRIFVLAPEPGQPTIRIYNQQNQLVRTFPPRDFDAGITAVDWDGRDDGGALVAPGTYRFVLRLLKPVRSARHIIVDLETMEVRGDRQAAPATTSIKSASPRLLVPGIARGGAWVALSGPARGQDTASVDVYDLMGRAVVNLETVRGGQGTWWSGQDAYGHRLPSGFYFFRERGDNVGEARRTLLIW